MIVTGLLLIMCACGQENRPDSKISSNHQANVDKKTESDGSSRLRKRQIDTMTMMPNRAQKISKIKSVRTIPVSVTNVYEPSRIEASPNEILELVFTRTKQQIKFNSKIFDETISFGYFSSHNLYRTTNINSMMPHTI